MITAFEVGSVFKIVDQSSPALRSILKSALALEKSTGAIQKNLTAISTAKLAGVATEIKAIATESAVARKELGSTASAMTRLSKASSGLSGAAAAIAGISSATQALALEWRSVAAEAATAVAAMRSAGRLRLPPPGGGSLPPPLPGRGGGRHGPRQGFHLGRFGASVPVLGGHVHASAPSSATGVGIGAGLFGLYELGKAGIAPMHEEAKLRLLNIPQATMSQMQSEARDIAVSVPGSGYTKNLAMMGELYSIVGAEGALAIAPRLAELDRVQGLVGGKGKDQGSAYTLTRATELMGKLTNPLTHQVDLDLFGKVLDNMSRISIATHGKVTPEEWLNYAKQAGPAAGNLTTEGLYTTAAIIQAMGGHRAGTAAAAVARQFAGGVMTASKAQELEKLGIFKSGDYEVGKGGHVIVKNDAAKDFVQKLMRDPLDAVVSDLIPALERGGFSSNEDMTRELYRVLGTATSQREIYELIRGREQVRQERERAKGAMAPGASMAALNEQDPEQVMGAFTTAFKDLLGAVGGPVTQAAIPGIQSLTKYFNELSAAASDHRTATGFLGTIAGGAALGAAAGFGIGWLGGPVGAGGGALAGGGAGAGYALWNLLPSSVRSGLATGATAGFAASPLLGPFAPVAPVVGGIMGGVWGGLGGMVSGADAKGVGPMVTTPPQEVKVEPAPVSVYLDSQKIGDFVIKYMAKVGSGPVEGAPYHDSTHSFTPLDFALPG